MAPVKPDRPWGNMDESFSCEQFCDEDTGAGVPERAAQTPQRRQCPASRTGGKPMANHTRWEELASENERLTGLADSRDRVPARTAMSAAAAGPSVNGAPRTAGGGSGSLATRPPSSRTRITLRLRRYLKRRRTSSVSGKLRPVIGSEEELSGRGSAGAGLARWVPGAVRRSGHIHPSRVDHAHSFSGAPTYLSLRRAAAAAAIPSTTPTL